MAADGSLKFDTKIDTSDFDTSVATLEKALYRLTQSVDKLSNDILNAFQGAGNAAETAADKAHKAAEGVEAVNDAAEKTQGAAKGIDAITESAEEAKKEVVDLEKEMEKIPVHFGETSEPIEVPEKRVPIENPDAYGYDQSVIDFVENYGKEAEEAKKHVNEFEQEITSLQNQMKKMESQGMWFGDEEYDEAFLKLSRVKQALADYKHEILSPTPDVEVKVKLDSGLFKAQKERLLAELKEMESHGASFGNADYDQKYATLQRVIAAENAYKRSLLEVDSGQKKAKQSTDRLTKSLDKSGKSAKKTGNRMSMLGMVGRAMLISFAMQAVMAVGNAVKEGMQNLAQYSNQTNQTLSSFMSSLTYLKNSLAAGFAPVLNYVVPALNMLIDALAQAIAWISQFFAILGGSSTFIRAKKTQEDYAKSLRKTGGAADDAKKSLAGFDQLTVLNDQKSSGGSGGSETDPSEMFETVAVDSTLATVVDSIKARLQELQSIFADGFWDGLGDPSVFDSIQTHLSGIKQSLFEIFSDGQVSAAAENMVNQFVYALGQIIGSILSIGLTIADNLLGGFELYLAQNKDRLKTQLIELFNIGADISKAVGDWFDILADIFSVFRSDGAKQITADLIKIFSDAVFGIVDLIGSFLSDTLETVVGTVGDRKEEIKGLLSEVIQSVQKLTGTVAELVAGFFDGLNAFYDKHQEKIQLVISLLTQMILNFIEIGILKFKYFVDSITAVIEMLMGVFDGLITFISGVLTGDWEKAWGGLKDIFRSIFNGIVDIAENAINFIIESLNAMHFDIPDWVPGIGGSDFGFDITPVRLPRLASGTVVPRQAGEFAAILGDNNREAEVVSPISTMKQAFIEAMRETGMNFGGGDIQLTVNLDGKVVYDAVVKRNQMTKKQTGKNPLLV